RLSSKKTKDFPYGLYKLENMMSVSVALMILYVGVEIAKKALFYEHQYPQVTPIIILGVFLGVSLTILFGWYAISVGRRTDSPMLIAEGRHREVDVLSSLVVFISLISAYLGFNIDRFAGLIVAGFIMYAGWGLLIDGMRVLLDASLDPSTLQKIQKIITSEPGVVELVSLVGRSAGRYRFIEATVVVNTSDLKEAHVISENIEKAISKAVPNVARVLIHYEPEVPRYIRIAVPVDDRNGKISPHFGKAKYFIILVMDSESGKIEESLFLSNPFVDIKTQKGIKVAEWLLKQDVDIVVTPLDLKGKGPAYVLSSKDVEIIHLPYKDIDSIIDAISEHIKIDRLR
ncbi:MAG: cation diffusion facilitator family transporter, partial [Nitrospirae bacterium]